jgi:site-specific recombinase XerD
LETNNQINLDRNEYNLLPKEHQSFTRPEWGKPFIMNIDGKSIDLNSGNILNLLYSKLSNFSVEIEKADSAPVYLGSLQNFIQVAKERKINLIGKDIDFFGDEWDFREFRLRTQAPTHFRYNLKNATDGLNDYFNIVLRLFLYYIISDKGVQHTSTYSTFNTIKNFVQEIFRKRIYNLKYLNRSDIENYIEQKKWLYSSQTKGKTAIKYFLSMYSFVIEDVYTKDIDHFLSDVDRTKLNAIVLENKIPLLSTEIFNKIETELLKTLNNDKKHKKFRLVAGLVLICMQTGLRPSELVNLEKKSLTIEKFGDKVLGKLSYYSSKTRHKQENIITTIATTKAINVFNKMIEIDKENCSKYLAFDKDGLPFAVGKFSGRFRRLCVESCIEMGLMHNSNPSQFVSTIKMKDALRQYATRAKPPSGTKEEDLISLPTLTQFRVYFASDLRARGVDDRRISLMLGHSSKDMFGYYARGAGEVQEEKQAIEQLIYEVADNKASLLGPKGNEFESRIKKFMEKNNYNVKENLRQIIDGITNESELRMKLGGFCIHSSKRRTCHYDTTTDEFFCAYGCCPNHCHTYFSAPITYEKFKEIVVAVKYNLSNSFNQQAEKEMKKLKVIILYELKPEIDDLVLQLSKQSAESIMERHPNTEHIINSIDEIKNEIAEWTENISKLEKKIKGESEWI